MRLSGWIAGIVIFGFAACPLPGTEAHTLLQEEWFQEPGLPQDADQVPPGDREEQDSEEPRDEESAESGEEESAEEEPGGWLMQQLQCTQIGQYFECRNINVGGWTQWGYHDESNGLFNRHPDGFNLHQNWLFVEKAAQTDECCWDWGYRFDAVYGVDAQDTQSFGNNPGRWDYLNGFDHGIYGWAIPQLYGVLATDSLSIKVGHFFTPVGYEVVPATGNFFYSHAYTMYNSEPFTHTGVLASYEAGQGVTLHGGWTLGWDTGFDRFDDGSNFLGGASVELRDGVTATWITTIGDFGVRGEGYAHSFVLDSTICENLNYVFQSDLVLTDAASSNDQVGVNQYLFYTVNECVKLGTRLEWWKSDGNSQNEVTFGANLRPYENLTFRPEIRHDWNPGNNNDFATFGIDVLVIF